mmetsp:Transcript_37159/g.80806  ORF Transcript_37159/g.80806 Transcript_37159/m.80806 type:complete len:196 (-) Transcript_37159:80-667(-)|eukprot:CAMPEP_0206530604 /NCGR_PEP_ID=MMETSP0325_2-20121206/3273_1 /ASSEMBLY_ACC=CAM_ASM_000347 /TAXON_ID=2866 /ORGANISM="Crypthecodinium cohnii, Strain Seligo" /LENGTH=195 /DNA_ID=CAMNT_0054026697 /DNA_START=47 /DNA_END=634 /DNA_ORIENTATION=+
MPSPSGGGFAAPVVPRLRILSGSASEPQLQAPPARGPTPVKRQSIRKRAAEMVALGSLVSHGCTGSLQHDHLRRVRGVLKATDEFQCQQAAGAAPPPRTKEWTREMLQLEKQLARQQARTIKEPQWRLRRGTWYYEGGEQEVDTSISATEAVERFVKAEEALGPGPEYRNGILGIPGQTRRWRKRNPYGGFYEAT